MDFGVVLQTNPPACAHGAARQARRGARLQPRVDLRLAPALAGAVRHLQPDPRRDPAGHGRPVRHQPGDPRLDGDGIACSRPSTRCTATAPSAASAAATRRCASPTASRRRSTELRESIHVIRELAQLPRRSSTRARRCSSRGAAAPSSRSGSPRTARWRSSSTGEVGDGFILQLADVDIAEWMIKTVRDAAADAGRDPDVDHVLRRRADVHRRRLGAHARPVPLVRRHGRQPRRRHRREVRRRTARCPTALTDYIKGREGYDYNEHGRAGNTHADFVPDEIVDRFCILGTAEEHIAKLEAAQGDRRRPVRRLPPARQQGGDPAGLRRDGHPRAARARGGQGVSAARSRATAVLARLGTVEWHEKPLGNRRGGGGSAGRLQRSTGGSDGSPAPAATSSAAPSGSTGPDGRPFVIEEIGELDEPWAMTFLPDGRSLITGRGGELTLARHRRADGRRVRGAGGGARRAGRAGRRHRRAGLRVHPARLPQLGRGRRRWLGRGGGPGDARPTDGGEPASTT